MTETNHEAENPFSVVDEKQLEKAQNVITMIKEQDEFTSDEADEIIGFIYEKLGLWWDTSV